MSDSDNPVSAVGTQQKRRRQESDSDSENDFIEFKKYKRKAAELKARMQQMSSDSEEDNCVKPIQKRQKLLQDGEGPNEKDDSLGSLTAEKGNLGRRFSSAQKNNENRALKGQVEISGCEDSDSEIIANEEEENDKKKLRAKHLTERKKLQEGNCSSGDLVDCISCDDVTKKSPAKEDKRKSENISDDSENSVHSSSSKQGMPINFKKSVDKTVSSQEKCMFREQVTGSESQNEILNISKSALESVNNEEKQQNTETKVKDGREAAFDSDSMDEAPPMTVAKKSVKERESSTCSDRKKYEEKQQNIKRKVKDGEEVASDSDSTQEPLKTIAKKIVKQRDSSTGSDRKNNKEKQQNTKRKVKDGEEMATDSDSTEEPLKTIAKKIVKQRDSSTGSDRDNYKEKQQNTKRKVKDGKEVPSDSDSVDKPLKTLAKKIVKQRHSSTDSDGVNNKDKQQTSTAKVNSGREVASDYDSSEEPLKTVAKKTVKQRGISTGLDRGNNKEKQQNARTRVRGGRETASDSDSMEEESLKSTVRKNDKHGVSYPASDKDRRVSKQQKAKRKMRDRLGQDSDSEEEKLLKAVPKKIIGKREDNPGEVSCKKKHPRAKKTIKSGRLKDSGSDSEDEKPVNTFSKKTVRQRGGLYDATSSKQKPQIVKTKIHRREGQVNDSYSEEEVSAEDSIEGKLRKITKGSESSPDKNSKVTKSKPNRQKEIRMHTSDSDDDDGLLKMFKEKTEKQSRKREKGKETCRKYYDSDMEAEKSVKNSRQETRTISDSSYMTVDQSVRPKESQKNHKKGKAELILSDSAEESDVSAGNGRSKKTIKKDSYGSASDVASDALENMAVVNAVQGMKGKQSTEDTTDSSDVDEHKSKKSGESKTSYHAMSSTESEDSSAGTKTRKTEAIRKASSNKNSHKTSGSSVDSSDCDEKNSRKYEQEKGKKVS